MVIVQHTPWWVFAVLALLIATGVQALRPRVVPVWRLLIVPAIFIAWGILGVTQRSFGAPMLAVDWVAAGAFAAAIGWVTTRFDGLSFTADGAVSVPGSPLPLVRNAVIFVIRYGLGVGAAFAADDAARAQLVMFDVIVSGLMTGYFVGWLGRFARTRAALTAA